MSNTWHSEDLHKASFAVVITRYSVLGPAIESKIFHRI